MLNWLKNIFGKKEEQPTSTPKQPTSTWQTSNSIFSFLKANRDAQGALTEAAQDLPDEEKSTETITFAPGFMDTMFGADQSEEAQDKVQHLVHLINRVARRGDAASKAQFYTAITTDDQVVGIIDNFLQALIQSKPPVEPHLLYYAHDLATETNHRNAVKFGIAILGLCQETMPIEDIKILGLHDEFTIFSIVALYGLSDKLLQDLWYLAKRLDGWGKIQLVDRMAEMDLPQEIRDWLVYEGYKNNIMYQYLALTCAINGQLDQKLAQNTIDNKLFVAAGELIDALLEDGPAAGIEEYPDSLHTLNNYWRHAKTQALTLSDFLLLHQLKDYLQEAQQQPEGSGLEHWEEDDFSNGILDSRALIFSKDWTAITQEALASSDSVTYWQGKAAAKILGIDLWSTLWNKVQKNPFEESAWFDITRYEAPKQAPKIIAFALEVFPLAVSTTGPENTMGFDKKYQKDRALEYIVTFLEEHPTSGEALILAGLNNPVIRTRNMTLRTLEHWTAKNWSPAIQRALVHLAAIEPSEDTKKDVNKLLKGERLTHSSLPTLGQE